MTSQGGDRLLAGTGTAEITPSLDVGILMSAAKRRWEPFLGVRRPLLARALMLKAAGRRVALVSLDLLGIQSRAVGGYVRFKREIVRASRQPLKPSQVILTSTHTHSAPESLALTNLYRTPSFQAWVRYLTNQIGRAVAEAACGLRPAELRLAVTQAPGLSFYRRVKTEEGIALRRPDVHGKKAVPRGAPSDDAVHVAALVGEEDKPIAVLVNTPCHPVHEMCLRQVSPDYPGEMCLELERRHPGSVALFLNGASGDLDPEGVSDGPEAARGHGLKLAEAVDRALHRARRDPAPRLALARSPVSLPAKTVSGRPARRPIAAHLAALRLGSAAFVFLPGEPFVEIGLRIREQSPFPFTAVAGYAENYLGYLPTDSSHDEGGYELGPGRWARVARGSEQRFLSAVRQLLHRLDECGAS